MTTPAPGRGPVARLRAAPLGLRLALLSALLTALVVGVAFLALRDRTERYVRRVFESELMTGQRGLGQLQDRYLHLLLASGSLVSTSPTLRAALQTWRVEANAGLAPRNELLATLEDEAQALLGEIDRDLLVVTDERGRVLAAAGRGALPRPGDRLGTLPAVHYALTTHAAVADSSFGVLVVGGAPLQVGCVAIVVSGYPIGALVLGERLDRFLPGAGVPGGSRAVVAAVGPGGGTVLASSLDSVRVGAAWSAPRLAAAGDAGRVRLAGEDFLAAALPLGYAQDGRAVNLYLLRSITASLRPISGTLGRSFLVAGAIAVLLVGAGAIGVSGATLRPLWRFVTFLRSGERSGAYARFDVAMQPPAEIGTLAEAYNGLIATLGTQHAQLAQRSTELAQANVTLLEQIRERERAEHALSESEARLRQSQKLEALGTLAGGVAHDFNNLLSVILGYTHLLAESLPPDSEQRSDAVEVGQAAQRAAGLVRQLLAFSRKQVLQPQVLELNHVVAGLEKMLRRLIAEDVDLQIRLDPQLYRVTADPGQVEQVILNLLVNARDAMPTGGTIVIETRNVRLDERYENQPEAIRGGPAAMLAVSDTGMGMDQATRERIFEPFFTTKAPGKGTGLGLATVYGIIRQSGGSITVYSEPGKGTTFRCYFPAVQETAEAAARDRADAVPSGSETVLLVEDESQVRAVMRRTLAGCGYRVLEASHGVEAIELAARHRGPIHLLVSDVVMPQLSGKETAERLLRERPKLKVLFVSGYADEAIARHGELTPGAVFVQKPVLPDALARAVRELLDASPAGGQ